MRSVAFSVLAASLCGTASAIPTDCEFLTPSLADLLTGGQYADGCYVDDKLFSNFTYTRGSELNPSAQSVGAILELTLGPNPPSGNLNEIGFAAIGARWTSDFAISYMISVFNPAVEGLAIVQAGLGLQGTGGSVSEILTGVDNYSVNAVVGSPGSSAINSETQLSVLLRALVGDGESISFLGNSFLQAAPPVTVPEPGTLALLGLGLAGLAAARRRKY